jgi:hypothetical protein
MENDDKENTEGAESTDNNVHSTGADGSSEGAESSGVLDVSHIMPPGFDPAIHAVDDAGLPRLTKTGAFAKKRGRKVNAEETAQQKQEAKNALLELANKTDIAAKAAANLTFNLGVMSFGEEWQPEKDEALAVKEAYRNYFDAKGITDFPPGVALAITLGAYALPRLRHENTKSKLSRFVSGVKNWFGKLRG